MAAKRGFVVLISVHWTPMSESPIEFESSILCKIPIQWKGAAAPDWTTLLRLFHPARQ
jgi:hypothetical protein